MRNLARHRTFLTTMLSSYLRQQPASRDAGSQARRPDKPAHERHIFISPRFERLEARNLLTAGLLDPAFGLGGKVTTNFEPFGFDLNVAKSVAIQNDGKIVAAGNAQHYTADAQASDFAIARYNTDGSLDSSFGNAGLLIVDISTNSFDGVTGMAIQPDGRILVSGFTYPDDSTGLFAVIRLTATGQLDQTFGNEGKRTFGFDGHTTVAKVDIPYAGIAISGNNIIIGGVSGQDFGAQLAVAELTLNGDLNLAFGNGGKQLVNFGGIVHDDGADAMAIQTDGKIILAGTTFIFDGNGGSSTSSLTITRLNTNGTPDTTFGIAGRQTIGVGQYSGATAVAVQSDGKIVLGGYTDGVQVQDTVIARLTSDGSLDGSFGQAGFTTTGLVEPGDGVALSIQPNGQIVVAGRLFTDDFNNTDFAAARFNANGLLDSGFGNSGGVNVDFTSADETRAVAIQPDGRIVLAGYAADSFALARLLADTPPVVITHPSNQTVDALSSVSFTAAASGSPTPTLQWVVSTDNGTTFNPISGAISTTLTFTATGNMTGYQYEAIFTNAAGTATTSAATLTVNKLNAVVTVNGYTGVYDALAHGATGSVVGVAGDALATGSSLNLGASFTNAPGGTANWVFTGGTNYNDQSGSAAIAISRRAVTVKANDQSKVYGSVDPALTYGITSGSLVAIDAFFGSLARDAGESVGIYAIKRGSLGLSDNYDLSFVQASLTILRATLSGDATTQDALNMAKQGKLNITVSNISGFKNGENAGVFLSSATFWITIGNQKYVFVPTTTTKLSNSSIAISYTLKDSALQASLADALSAATSASTAIKAGFSMDSTNYSLSDDYLTRLFSTLK